MAFYPCMSPSSSLWWLFWIEQLLIKTYSWKCVAIRLRHTITEFKPEAQTNYNRSSYLLQTALGSKWLRNSLKVPLCLYFLKKTKMTKKILHIGRRGIKTSFITTENNGVTSTSRLLSKNLSKKFRRVFEPKGSCNPWWKNMQENNQDIQVFLWVEMHT